MSNPDMESFKSQLKYAGFGERFAASIIDTIILTAVTAPFLYSIYGSDYWNSTEFLLGIPDFLISFVFPLVATVLFWVYKSATPGKMVLNIKVVDAETGAALTVKQSTARYLGYYVSVLPLGLGLLWVVWDSKKQSWHDKLAGTIVIHHKEKDVEKIAFSAENT